MPSQTQARPRLWISQTWPLATLGAAIVVAYARTFSVPLLLDDLANLANNPSIRRLWPIGPVLSPPAASGFGGRPLLNLSFAVDNWLGHGALPVFHATDLAIHIVAAFVLFGVVRRTLLLPLFSNRLRTHARGAAWATALLWALHPLQTEAVTYLSGRAESLMGLFYLLTLYGFIRAVLDGPAERERIHRGWSVLSVAACFCGMASKEVMVTAPATVALYDWVFLAGRSRKRWKRHGLIYAGLAASWVLLVFLMRGIGQRDVGFGGAVSWWQYAFTEAPIILRYLKLFVWPHPLVFFRTATFATRIVPELPAACGVIALLVAGAVAAFRRRPAGFAGLSVFVLLAPTSSIVPVLIQPMADHRMYLPSAALAALLVGAGYAALDRSGLSLCTAAAVGFGVLTWNRNEQFRSAVSIWRDSVIKDPNSSAWNDLAIAYLNAGDYPEALESATQALRYEPHNMRAYNDRADALAEMKRYSEAIAQYDEAIRLQPDFTEAKNNRQAILNLLQDHAAALAEAGRWPEALSEFRVLVKEMPNSALNRYNEGLALDHIGRRTEAMAWYRKAILADPALAEAHTNLAIDLLRTPGGAAEALREFQEVVKLRPNSAAAHRNLAAAYQATGNRAGMRAELQKVEAAPPPP